MLLKLVFKRSKAQASTLLAILALVFMTALMLSASFAFISQSTSGGVANRFAEGKLTDRISQFQIPAGSDPEQQIRATEAVVWQSVPERAFEATFQLRSSGADYRSLASESDPATKSVRLVALAGTVPSSAATLSTGTWPTELENSAAEARYQVALSEQSANELGLELGAVFSLNRADAVQLELVGIYQPNSDSAFWFVDSNLASGTAESNNFPIVFAGSDFSKVFSAPRLLLTLEAEAEAFEASAITQVNTELGKIAERLKADPQVSSGQGVSQGGNLGATIAEISAELDAAQAVLPVPIILISVLSLVALSQLVTLLLTQRRQETVLLKSRGLKDNHLIAITVVEALVITAPAAFIGAYLAPIIMSLVLNKTVELPQTALIALLTIVVAVFSIWVLSARDISQPLGREQRVESGRAGVTAWILPALLLIATLVSLWRFYSNGSALYLQSDGTVALDPIALLAPVLLIILFSFVALWIFAPISRLSAKTTVQKSKVQRYLSWHQISRRLNIFQVAFVLVSLAVSSIAFTSVYSASWQQISKATSSFELPAGAKIQLVDQVLTAQGSQNRILSTVAELDQFELYPVLEESFSYGRFNAELLSVSANNLATLSESSEYFNQFKELLEGSSTPDSAILITQNETLRFKADSNLPEVAATAWLFNPEFGVFNQQLSLQDSSDTQLSFELSLPKALQETKAPSELLGFEVRWLEQELGKYHFNWLGAARLSNSVETELKLPSQLVEQSIDEELIWPAESPSVRQRSFSAVAETALKEPVSVVVSKDFAEALALELGSNFKLDLANSGEFEAVVTDIVPAISGSGSKLAVLAELGTVYRAKTAKAVQYEAANQFWLSQDTALSPETAELVPKLQGSTLEIRGNANTIASASVTTAWFGVAGIIALSITALIAVSTVILANRRSEIPILRAIGLSAKAQAKTRRRELVTVLGQAAGFGVISGLLTAWATVPAIAQSTILARPDFLKADFAIDLIPSLWALAALGLAAAIITIGYGVVVQKQALDTEYREETR